MKKFSSREKSSVFVNACPATTLGAVYEKTGIYFNQKDEKLPAFRFVYTTDASELRPSELMILDPGESIEMPADLAQDFLERGKNCGIVKLVEGEDETAAKIRGLSEFVKFLDSRGTKQIVKFKTRGNFNPDEMEAKKQECLQGYYLNQAKSSYVKEEIAKLNKAKKVASA